MSHAGKYSVQHEQHHAAVLYHAAGLCAAPHRFSERCVRGRSQQVRVLCGTAGAAVPRPWQKRCPRHLRWPVCTVLLCGHAGVHPCDLGAGKAVFEGHRPCGRVRSGVLPLVGCHPRLGFSAEHLRRCQHVQPDDPWQRAAVQHHGSGHSDAGSAHCPGTDRQYG